MCGGDVASRPQAHDVFGRTAEEQGAEGAAHKGSSTLRIEGISGNQKKIVKQLKEFFQ